MVILFQSTSPIRHAFYEFFLHLHILLAITSFVGLWYHLRGLALQRVLLVTLILWGLDVSLDHLLPPPAPRFYPLCVSLFLGFRGSFRLS